MIVLHRDPVGDEARRGDAGKAIWRAPGGFHAKAIGESWNRRSRIILEDREGSKNGSSIVKGFAVLQILRQRSIIEIG